MYGSESDTAVLIDRDAYLYGSFRAVCAENIDILGYGVIDGSREVRTDESRLLLNDYTAPLPADRENILRRLKQRHVLDGILRFTVAATSGWRSHPARRRYLCGHPGRMRGRHAGKPQDNRNVALQCGRH